MPFNRRDQTRNIIVAGETGVGKSSLINLVIGRDCCTTGNDARGITIGTQCYDWVPKNDDSDGVEGCSNQIFRLWDTPGLGEGSRGTVSPKQAQEALRMLLTELKKGGNGVHLLILCMRGLPRVTKGMKQTYDAVVRIRDKVVPEVPVVAVITELEKKSLPSENIILSMDNWWGTNVGTFKEFAMPFSGHACITTLTDDCHPKMPGRRGLCQRLVRQLIVDCVSPKLARNVIIAGEIGVGKSSLVNLVLGDDRAVVSSDVCPITTTTSQYDWNAGNEIFHLWDTLGIGEGLHGNGFQKRAQEKLRSLFASLEEEGGVHLLVVCIRRIPRATATKRTYDFIMKIRDELSPKTPVVTVITELENRSLDSTLLSDVMLSMEEWWTTNSQVFSDNGISFEDHACITCLEDDESHPLVPGRREACRELVRGLILRRSARPPPMIPRDLHVLLFGETGVGKSSLVNLLSGWQIASVSPDSIPCTLDASEYQFQLGKAAIRLWDTVGLEEPTDKDGGGLDANGSYVGAIEKAVTLIRRLNATGGVSLFLFCIRGNRITATTQSNYRLFYEVLGKEQVPVAVVVTQLEDELEDMEDWWTRNGKTLEQYGIHSAAHACVTTLDGHARCATSREVLQGLLSQFDEQGKFLMPPEAWIMWIIRGFRSLVDRSSKLVFPRGRDLMKVLTTRCNMEADVAQRVAACIDSSDG